MNLLFTCAGRRNYLLQYFREALEGRGKVLAADMSSTAPALQEADQWFAVPAVADDDYIPAVLSICRDNDVKLVISLNDVELPILAQHRDEFAACGAELLISPPEVIDLCFDKLKTGEFLKAHDLPYPTTYIDLDSALHDLHQGQVRFPLFVKPRWGSASMQIFRVDSEKELQLAYELAMIQLQKTFLKVDDKLVAESILIQQGLPGDEFGLDILNDRNGTVRSVFVKRKLGMRAGETEKSQLVDIPELHALGEKIGTLAGHIGNLDCDVFFDGTTATVLEMNPRFGGGYPFSQTLGADYPRAILEWYQSSEFDTGAFDRLYDKTVSKCDKLVFVDQ